MRQAYRARFRTTETAAAEKDFFDMNVNKVWLAVILGAGLMGCANGSVQPPNVVQDSGLSATGNSPYGGALAAPPGVGSFTPRSY